MPRIVYANLGYSRDIDGSLGHHVRRVHHHIYTPRDVQVRSLTFVKEMLREMKPDLSCFVEIDRGSLTNGFFDQLPILREDHHATVQIDSKYALERKFRRFSISKGKSNAFLASQPLQFEARYLDFGKKRLVYDIDIEGIRVLIAHCSLLRRVRERQFEQIAAWTREKDAPTVVMGDFNIFRGCRELEPLLHDRRFVHLNGALGPTFRLGPYRASLDTCLVSNDIAGRCELEIVNQPFSDHQMLRIDIRPEGETLREQIEKQAAVA
ncbi:endonuclease/exonuclease/phosphatase family protein [Aureimonas populi]|uniref:Endonuclease/exonuclease/phosphatase family protein n=1 Tax=Aureimonas populi TaxID=1701758 RepID=A0ABW5CQB5_9HYPH|nr:endonuclease/exonuclease/phosphatase family protein [Aureimonas populi]